MRVIPRKPWNIRYLPLSPIWSGMDVTFALFGVLPYFVLGVFAAGILYRVYLWVHARHLTGLYNVNVGYYENSRASVTKDVLKRIFLFYTVSDKERDRELYVGSMSFHWGIWVALFGHLGVFLPESYLSTMGITPQIHHALGLYVGGTGGVVALVGLLLLIDRRLRGVRTNVKLMKTYSVHVPLRKLSFLDDYFAAFLLLAVILSGLFQTFFVSPSNPGYLADVSSWISSLVSLHPSVSYINSLGAFQVHMLIVMVFLAYFPWGKMLHLFSFLFMPTTSRSAIRVEL